VVEVKYGRRLQAAFAQPGGDQLKDWIDGMPNERYQSMFAYTGADLRKQFCDGAPPEVRSLLDAVPDEDLAPLLQDLGGHDLGAMLAAYAECDAATDRPSVVFAYTVKGWGLPLAGNPRNHSALLTGDQIAEVRATTGLSPDTEWDRLDPATPAGAWAGQRREALARAPREPSLNVTVPDATGVRTTKPVSTQEAFGRVLVDLARNPSVAQYLVTTAPDVATSTNLAGFINKTGVFHPAELPSWGDDPLIKWAQSPSGQHIELGISEMNLFLLLGQLGLSWDLSGQPLLPVGTVYDPFVCRGLDALIYGTYSASRFVIAGTPSGVTLAPEGGAHQSTITASIGLELPGLTFIEPAYAGALDWLLCDALGRIAAGPSGPSTAVPAEHGSYYFRLTTRPLDQAPFEAAKARIGETMLRRQVLAGAYRLVEATVDGPPVYLVGTGAVLPEVLAAAEELADEGVAAHVIDVTSLDRLYSAWQRTLRQGVRTATAPSTAGALRQVFGDRAPIVTVHDASSHAMAWLGSALGAPCVPLGVDQFGQSGTVQELYELHDLLPGSIVNAALAALSL
jgi:pyruvate dehydrogenase E1 component